MHLHHSLQSVRTGSLLAFMCVLLATFQFGCATGGSGSGSQQLGSISLPRTAPTKAMQSTTAVMARYSYATSAVTYPTQMSFQKTGNTPDSLATGTSGVLEFSFTQIGKDTQLSARSLSGQYDSGKIKSLLSAIREESQNRAFANQLYGDG